MRVRADLAAGLLLAALAASSAPAQQDDLTLPPRIEPRADEAAAPSGAGDAAARPGAARLADPVDGPDAPIEELVVIGERRWRLPDLGSEWRREQEEARGDARVEVRFFQPYVPHDPTAWTDPFPINSEMRRVGFIELFELRFGRR